jgi:hypothetical protein
MLRVEPRACTIAGRRSYGEQKRSQRMAQHR